MLVRRQNCFWTEAVAVEPVDLTREECAASWAVSPIRIERTAS